MPVLRRLGFTGSDAAVLARAARDAPELLAACASTSSMWAANAATVSPAFDTADGRLHLTPANLVSQLHRALETPATTAVLRKIFAAERHFVVHDPLPAALQLADEGAANHTRLAPAHGRTGIEVFVHGRAGDGLPAGGRFPARQTLAASEAVARLHGLVPERTVHLRQSAAALDAGVFHNDVIAVGNEHVWLVHEEAYAEGPAAVGAVRRCYAAACGPDDETLTVIEVPSAEVSLATAVETYLFNSQLVTLPAAVGQGGRAWGMALICPAECREDPATSRWLDRLVAADNSVVAVYPVDVRQSMANGGGPACLRLRVVLTREQLESLPPGVLVTAERLDALEAWVRRHYRDRLEVTDLADPALLEESRRALAELPLQGVGISDHV